MKPYTIYIYMYTFIYIWYYIPPIHKQMRLSVCGMGQKSETAMQRIYLAGENYATILCLAACLATDTPAATAWCRHSVGLCRWQCIDKTMAVHFAAHLAWRNGKKMA